MPDDVEPMDLVDARTSAGGHARPEDVLLWLVGKADGPWGGDASRWGEVAAVEELGRRIRQLAE